MRIGEAIRLSARLAAVAFAGGARAGDHLGTDRPAFRLVAVKQRFRCGALQQQGELPGEIVGVLDSGVHALAAGRGMDVGRIAGNEHAAAAVGVREPHADAKNRRPAQVRQFWFLRQEVVGDRLELGELRAGKLGLNAVAGAAGSRELRRCEHRYPVTAGLGEGNGDEHVRRGVLDQAQRPQRHAAR